MIKGVGMRGILLLLILLVFSCSGGTARDEGILETIILDGSCTDIECCEEACKKFCRDQNRRYAKDHLNGNHCGCWCD